MERFRTELLSGLKAWWPVFAFFLILNSTILFQTYLVDFRTMFDVWAPRGELANPFYFLQNDYVGGAVSLLGLISCLLLILFVLKSNSEQVLLVAAGASLYLLADAGLFASIQANCSNLFTGLNPSCTWHTMAEYRADIFHIRLRQASQWASVAIFLFWGVQKLRGIISDNRNRAT